MRLPRRVTNATLRLLWTLLLVVFSAHHAAPDAPIWQGAGFASHHDHSSELAFTSVHADHHSHCELCFASAFAPSATVRSLPRVALLDPRSSSAALDRGAARDQRLPEAHAPPRA
jgi:hypothetical protein